MGTTSSTSRAAMKEVVPPWIYTVSIPHEHVQDKVAACSEGMNLMGPNTVQRVSQSFLETDCFRWSRGFTSGKHTFEILYPTELRGSCATVGVGLDTAPLHSKGKVPLVGANKSSWGLDLCTRRTFHNSAIVKKYPQTQVFLPDKFYMYLDADAGQVQFGSDAEYYGTAISGLPAGKPVYPMLSSAQPGAVINIVYRGQGNTHNTAPAFQQPTVVVISTTAPPAAAYSQHPVQPPPGMVAAQPSTSPAPPLETKETPA